MRLYAAILALILTLSGCRLVYDDYYYGPNHYYYESDTYVDVCPFCHDYHTGSCARPVYIIRCRTCLRFHSGICIRVHRHGR